MVFVLFALCLLVALSCLCLYDVCVRAVLCVLHASKTFLEAVVYFICVCHDFMYSLHRIIIIIISSYYFPTLWQWTYGAVLGDQRATEFYSSLIIGRWHSERCKCGQASDNHKWLFSLKQKCLCVFACLCLCLCVFCATIMNSPNV